VLAFLAVLIALPHWITGLSFLFNLVLSIFAARSDERVLAASPLAADYAAYRERTGMFLPKFSRPAPGR
jgi:protein-S-isoprenylcysteine O-methyltransferase Ste14